MRNDIERAVDTVLSGLTVDASRQEQLLHGALQAKQAAPAQKRQLSFCFAPSHRLVAALVILLILVLPLVTLPMKDPYVRYSSEDGLDYFVTSYNEPTPSTGAIADSNPDRYAQDSYRGSSIEEAAAVYGSDFPQLTWLPESAHLESVSVTIARRMRTTNFIYRDPYVLFCVEDNFTDEIGNHWFPQDDVGEYRTLSNDQQIYITTNYGRCTIIWQQGLTIYSLATDASLEDAIRMVESVR